MSLLVIKLMHVCFMNVLLLDSFFKSTLPNYRTVLSSTDLGCDGGRSAYPPHNSSVLSFLCISLLGLRRGKGKALPMVDNFRKRVCLAFANSNSGCILRDSARDPLPEEGITWSHYCMLRMGRAGAGVWKGLVSLSTKLVLTGTP